MRSMRSNSKNSERKQQIFCKRTPDRLCCPGLSLIHIYREYKKAKQDAEDSLFMLESESDEEMRELLKEEHSEAKKRIQELEQELKILLLPKDPNDDKNVIVEIRAGAGGDEAALFAAEMYRLYVKYAERNRWKVEMCIRDSSCAACAVYHDAAVFLFLSGNLQGVDDSCENHDSCSVLIVMENRNIQGGFQPFLNFKAAGSADIFQVDSSEAGSHPGDVYQRQCLNRCRGLSFFKIPGRR